MNEHTEELFQSTKGANISSCKRYRYKLWREWDADGKTCVFIGLNPSTADAVTDDKTISRCVGFAKRWGYGRLMMVNLFAYRSTDPSKLKEVTDPIGEDNDEVVTSVCREGDLVIAAWGNHGELLERATNVIEMVKNECDLMCFKVTGKGHPIHPLYQPNDTALIAFQ